MRIINLVGSVIKTISHIRGIYCLAPLRPNTIAYLKRKSSTEVVFLNIENSAQNSNAFPKCLVNIFSATDITSDSSGNIYISCSTTNKIYMLRPDSQDWKEIITKSDGINCPVSVDCNPERVIYVINDDGKSIPKAIE